MNKKSAVIGWHCYIDFFDSKTEALKGKIIDTDNNGVIIESDNKIKFVSWKAIKQIQRRDD